MNLKVFSLDSVKELGNGSAARVFGQHLTRAAADCYDRPGDATARKVSLEVLVRPVLDDDGGCTEVHLEVQTFSAVPKHRTKVFSLGLKPNGSMVYNPDSPDNINQSTWLDADANADSDDE